MRAVPYSREIDYQSPFEAFRRLAAQPYPVFLDSALQHDHLGRYAFIAVDPFSTLSSKDGRVTRDGVTMNGDPFEALHAELARFPMAHDPALPPFQGGAAGFLGYDLLHHLERVPRHAADDMRFPDLALGLYDACVAFDLLVQRAWLVSTGFPETETLPRERRAQQRLEQLADWLAAAPAPLPPDGAAGIGALQPNVSRHDYEAAVQRVIDYIYAGDIFQANLTQRFAAELSAGFSPLALYAQLREVSPAPFAAFQQFGDVSILSASPERFLRLSGRAVETRPIKGTRPRGADPVSDAQLKDELLHSEKDRAENVMIVDLLRNDLSRVCADHSVHTPVICGLETYANVHHLVSVVEGQLRPGMSAVDLLRATLPGGSITGAPKIRAMEIIAELEPTQRGPYCGSMGYIGFNGEMDTSITIRTITVKGDRLCFQVGGGVVADSHPAAEYDETLAKASGLLAALGQGAVAAR